MRVDSARPCEHGGLDSVLHHERGMKTNYVTKTNVDLGLRNAPDFRVRGAIAWTPNLGYLLALMGGLAVTAVGCRGKEAGDATPRSYEPAVVTSAATPSVMPANLVSPQPSAPVVSPKLPAALEPPSAAVAAPQVPVKPATVTVKRFIVTTGVSNREPVANGETIELGQPVFAFAELSAGAGTDAEVEIVFEHEGGRKVGHIELGVPGDKSRWRTWGQPRGVTQVGHWTAVLLDSEGTELARAGFDVTAPEPAANPPALDAQPTPVTGREPKAVVPSSEHAALTTP